MALFFLVLIFNLSRENNYFQPFHKLFLQLLVRKSILTSDARQRFSLTIVLNVFISPFSHHLTKHWRTVCTKWFVNYICFIASCGSCCSSRSSSSCSCSPSTGRRIERMIIFSYFVTTSCHVASCSCHF